MRRPLVYLAAPLFNPSERTLNLELRRRMDVHVDVYLPQSDGTLLVDELAKGVAYEAASEKIFSGDTSAIARADALLIVLDGRTIDEGAAFELGVAWSLGKICVGYKSDTRRLLASGDNPMIATALKTILTNPKEVEGWAASLRSAIPNQ
jgi:nucleoside 2-deoxyribosyltransferase